MVEGLAILGIALIATSLFGHWLDLKDRRKSQPWERERRTYGVR